MRGRLMFSRIKLRRGRPCASRVLRMAKPSDKCETLQINSRNRSPRVLIRGAGGHFLFAAILKFEPKLPLFRRQHIA